MPTYCSNSLENLTATINVRSSNAVYSPVLPPLRTVSCIIWRDKYDIYVISMSLICRFYVIK